MKFRAKRGMRPPTLGLATALVLLATALSLGQSPGAVAFASTSSHPYTGAGLLGLNNGDMDASTTSNADYIVMEPWEASRIPSIRASNPNVEILMYKNASATRNDVGPGGYYSTGVPYSQALASGWLLHNPDGTIQAYGDYTALHPANVGSAAYQNAWYANVLADLQKGDWDGVMLDDTLTTLSHPILNRCLTASDACRSSQEIPTSSAEYAAMRSFLANVGPKLHNAGYLAFPNVTVFYNNWSSTFADWTPFVSGWENEFFTKGGLDSSSPRYTGSDWTWRMQMAAWGAQYQVPLLNIDYSDNSDVAAKLYHRASWLLYWNGVTGASIFVPKDANTDHWQAKAVLYPGTPTAAETVNANTGVHSRMFSNGRVLVNPTNTSRTVSLGKTYYNPSGTPVTSVTLNPATGTILRSSL